MNLFDRKKVNPGDTVYIDGGSDSLIYKKYNNTNANYNFVFYWDRSGNSENKIVITRGKEIGHNGIPIFRGDTTKTIPIWFDNVDFVELSYVKVDTAYEGGAWNFQHYGCVHITNCNHIDILHNDLNYVVSSESLYLILIISIYNSIIFIQEELITTILMMEFIFLLMMMETIMVILIYPIIE